MAQIEVLKRQLAVLTMPASPTPSSGAGGSTPGYLVYDIKFFADRVWKFSDSIKPLGSNVKSPSVISKIAAKKWTLPGFNYSTLSNLLRKDLPATTVSQPASLSSLDAGAKTKIPTDIVFPKLAGGLVDLPVHLSFDKKGIGTQTINTVPGAPLSLLIKPSSPTTTVKGVISLKKTTYSKVKTFVAVQKPESLLQQGTASLQDAEVEPEITPYASDAIFVLQQFDYVDIGEGLWRANILSPAVEGEYEILTSIQYENHYAPVQTKLIMVIDPEGYVYTQLREGRLRIQGAVVSIYQRDPLTKKYALWDAQKFNQKNPITTNDTGKYAFLVPPGMYYMKAEAKNYKVWESVKFEVKLNNSIHIDIPLKKKSLLDRILGR
ncbi:MAG: carboxypeptidase-like regulatory domain-containing protein [bacterium]|nr:carboxypeptidase-like regulatory domain-containing protein [bacterium]